MPAEIETLIGDSVQIRSQIQKLQEQLDLNRKRILDIMTAENRKSYIYGNCRALRTEEISIESVSKELFIKALKDADIPRDKKVFIWNQSIKEVKRPASVMLQTIKAGQHPID